MTLLTVINTESTGLSALQETNSTAAKQTGLSSLSAADAAKPTGMTALSATDAPKAAGMTILSAAETPQQATGYTVLAAAQEAAQAAVSQITPLPQQEQDDGGQVLEFTGLDLREKAGSGSYLECANVSTRNYPCLSPALSRTDDGLTDVDDIFRFDGKTVFRKGTQLWYDDGTGSGAVFVNSVADSRKQFAVVNTNLVVFPDAVRVSLATGDFMELGVDMSVTEAVIPNTRMITGSFPYGRTIKSPDMQNGNGFELIIPFYDDEESAKAADDTEKKFYADEDNTGIGISSYLDLIGKWIVPSLSMEAGYAVRYGELDKAAHRVDDLRDKTTDGVYGKIIDLYTTRQGESLYFYQLSAQMYLNGTSDNLPVKSGDVIFISGLLDSDGEEVDEFATRVWESTATSLTVDTNALYGMKVNTDKTVTIKRKVPELDYICANSNRLWGVSNQVENTVLDDSGTPVTFNGRAIFCSKLGDPTNWYYYQSTSLDSWSSPISSEGDFTGICAWSDDILCFKEREMYRITGTSSFTQYAFSVPGVEQGSGGSIAIIDEVVYYKNERGVYRYSGGTPTLVSENVNDAFKGAGNAGSDGRNYFLSVPNGLFVYDTWNKAWARHDSAVGRFAWDGGTVLFLVDSGASQDVEDTADGDTAKWTVKSVYRVDEGTADGVKWSVTLHPDYGTTQSSYYSTSLNMGWKYYKFVFLRGELLLDNASALALPTVSVYARMGNREDFDLIGTQSGAGKFLLRMPVDRYREDSIQLKLTGTGDCVLRDIRYVYSTGSEWVQSDKGGLQ